MPELPEVETTCRGLAKALQAAHILSVEQRRADLRRPMPANLAAALKGRSIAAIRRRAKYIIIDLTGGQSLILHLGMSGRLTVGPPDQSPGKHDHVIIHCDARRTLRFNDPRRFGLLDLCPTPEVERHAFLRHLGIEPLGPGLTAAYLAEKFMRRKTPMKAALLDQTIIAGLGNIYVSEALFHARIAPGRQAQTVTPAELRALIPAIKKVLNAALKAGGSSLRDYVQTNGALGFFQNQFSVYDRENTPCPRCRAQISRIQRITQSGRSTFFCPACQH